MGINVLKIDSFPKMAYEGSNDLENAVDPKLLVGLPKTRSCWKACEVYNKLDTLDWKIRHFLTDLCPWDRFHCQQPQNPQQVKKQKLQLLT